MFVDNLKRDFYELLIEERVLIIANHDVDAVCCTKILVHLFKIDNIAYTLETARGVEEMRVIFQAYFRQAKVVVLINCGGTVDILDLFENPKDTIFFVIDNHRPLHILNIYNESKQVRIVSPPSQEDDIPKFEDIFRDPEESSTEDSTSEEDPSEDELMIERSDRFEERKQRRLAAGYDPAKLDRHEKRRNWEDHRRSLLHDYSKYSYYGVPTSLVALELAWSLNRDQSDIVWWSIVGLTDFFTMRRVDRSNYTLLVTQVQTHVARINNSNTIPLDCLKINFEIEPNLFLYRQWNLYNSMKLTPDFACKFKTWTLKGLSRMHLYLAEIGLPLVQVRQTFKGMDLDLRRGLKEIMARREEKYKLEDLNIGSFIGMYGYKYKYSALDNHMATLAILEAPNGKSATDKFVMALQSLSKERYEVLETGIDEAKVLVIAIYKQVQQLLDLKQINATGSFMYAIMQEGPDARFFGSPNSLLLLAHFTLRAFVAHSVGFRQRHMPLVLISPPHEGECLAIGIPPVTADIATNLFGKAFEQLNTRQPNLLTLDCFETNICRVKNDQKQRFIEGLLGLLA